MQYLREQPCPEYLEAQTERTRTGSNKTQASVLPPSFAKSPLRPPFIKGGRGRCSRLPQTQSECSHASEDARPSGNAVAGTHANHGGKPAAHGNGPENAAQGIDS